MTNKSLDGLGKRILEACITGVTIGAMEYVTTGAIRSLREVALRNAVLIATPIAVAITLILRAVFKRVKNSAPQLGSQTRHREINPSGKDEPEFTSANYLMELRDKLHVSARPGDQLRFYDIAEDPTENGKHG